MLRALFAVSLVGVAACQQPIEPVAAEPLFDVGSDSDPVVQMALSALNTTTQITFTNNTRFGMSEGLIAFDYEMFREAKVASEEIKAFVLGTSADAGNALVLAARLGRTLGSDAFYVPAIGPGETRTIILSFPFANNKLSFVARVLGSEDDFLGVERFTTSLVDIGSKDPTPRGYDLNDGKQGTIALGNGTIGANPSITGVLLDLTQCPTTMNQPATLIDMKFTAGPWDHSWPWTIGFDGDFNGDWYTDGTTARMIDVNAKLPTISGFAKFFYVCPQAGAKVSAYADVSNMYKNAGSDTTLVIYFFDQSSRYISHAENWPLHGKNKRVHALYDAVIPAGTRKIAIVPMGYFASGETDSAHYYGLTAKYEPANAVTTTTLANDDFSSYDASKQPTGWAEYGGDWFVHPDHNWATVWNPSWQNPKPAVVPPLDTGLTKTFALGAVTASTKLSARVFAASTFTDPSSFVQLRLKFNTGEEVTASELRNAAWADLDVRRAAIPAGATSVTVTIQSFLGAGETSSVYVDSFNLAKVQ